MENCVGVGYLILCFFNCCIKSQSQHSCLCGIVSPFSCIDKTFVESFLLFLTVCIPLSSFSGLGYILGATIANATGDWRWALRVREYMFSKYILRVTTFYRKHCYSFTVLDLIYNSVNLNVDSVLHYILRV